jgi:hypothetical protein
LQEEEPDGRQRIPGPQVRRVPVGLEAVRQVLRERGDLTLRADDELRSAFPPGDADVDLLLVRPSEDLRVRRSDRGHALQQCADVGGKPRGQSVEQHRDLAGQDARPCGQTSSAPKPVRRSSCASQASITFAKAIS